MGLRGPAPKPTKLRVLHGDRKDRINFDEPPAPDGDPVCPDTVSAEVREVWDYTMAQLRAMNTVSPADRDSLLCYCEAVVIHRQASEIIAASGVLVPARRATGLDPDVDDAIPLVRSPALSIQQNAATLISKFAGQFGLSPSARSEIRNPRGGTNAKGGAERFLTG